MRFRRVVWILIILLTTVIIWEIIQLKENYRKIADAKPKDDSKITQRMMELQKDISDQTTLVGKIENIAIWDQENDPLLWVSGQAKKSAVSVIGIEHFPAEKISVYERIPVNIEIRGDYNTLSRFINELERSDKKLRIDSLRIRYKEHTSDKLTMDVLISYFVKSEL